MLFDTLVFGAGPAGAATALRLAANGASVVILDRRCNPLAWVGETFAGAIRAPLTQLGLWDAFRAGGHVAGHEIRSAWGGPEFTAESTLFRPDGANWHVNRARFDEGLRAAAVSCGAVLRNFRTLAEVTRDREAWRIRVDADPPLRARFLVDATGRARSLGRRLGATRRQIDRLVALVARVPRNGDPSHDHSMVVQTRRDGWWYAAPTPDAHVLAFLTDSDLVPADLRRTALRTVPANSALTDVGVTDGWLPVGDAFAAHDPLCGSGVERAINSGIIAADAILALLDTSDPEPLLGYRQRCVEEFHFYLKELAHYYALERRWSTAEFWARRTEFV
jgi:flavin-dependent dehydrogenase